jgi:hypothetical protein
MALFDSESLIIAGISLLSLFACCSLMGLWLYTRLNPDTLDKFLFRNQRSSALDPAQRRISQTRVSRMSTEGMKRNPTQSGARVTTIQVAPAGGARVDEDLEKWKAFIEQKEAIEKATQGALSNKKMKRYLEKKAKRDAEVALEAKEKVENVGYGRALVKVPSRKAPIVDTYSATSHHGHAHLLR